MTSEKGKELELALELPRPEPPETSWITPDLVVYRQTWEAPAGTPEIVAVRLKELQERRQEIERMWHEEGRTTQYIPFTEQGRQMRMRAKLQNRAETKHAEIVKRFVDMNQKAIELDPEVLEIAKPMEELSV